MLSKYTPFSAMARQLLGDEGSGNAAVLAETGDIDIKSVAKMADILFSSCITLHWPVLLCFDCQIMPAIPFSPSVALALF